MANMSFPRHAGVNWAGVILSFTLLSAATAAAQEERGGPQQASAPSAMPAEVLAAQTFVLTAYPDLATQPLLITLRQEGNAVLVSVVDDAAPGDPNDPRTPLVIARVDYDSRGRLRRFDARGALLNEARNDALRQQLLANPGWAESDADVWLTREGAASSFGTAFGPAQPAATAALERQLGATRTSTPARFRWRVDDDASPQARFRSRPVWTTEAVAVAPGGTADLYEFEYEPFGGRLVGVVRR